MPEHNGNSSQIPLCGSIFGDHLTFLIFAPWCMEHGFRRGRGSEVSGSAQSTNLGRMEVYKVYYAAKVQKYRFKYLWNTPGERQELTSGLELHVSSMSSL